MGSGMNLEQAKTYAEKMSYSQAVHNALCGYGIPYRKATKIKLNELLDVAKNIDKALKQEPCEDAISRSETIKYLNTNMAWYDEDGEMEDNDEKLKAITDLINGVPSVTPTQKWISCSERLPEDRREVLVTAYWHETYQVMMASYFGDGLWWCVPFNNSGEHAQRLKPKARMPLPERYKAESEGDE